jgi:hypothetical protein
MEKHVLEETDSLAGTGYDLDDLEQLRMEVENESIYTRRVDSPIYEPTAEEPPPIPTLYDTTYTNQLIEKIDTAELSDEVRQFLLAAASRHTVFNYANIAEFYAHAPTEIQQLMEAAALVIIDYEQAIEHGFLNLNLITDDILHNDYPDA